MNPNTSDGFTRKEGREMIRPKAGVLEITRAYEMVRERKIPRVFGGGGFYKYIINMFRNEIFE
jgi:hypothetical protein